MKDMIAIAFESSGGKASVAISRDGVILAQAENLARHGHAAWLLTLARDALAEAGLTAAECDVVLGGRGPGSFTGIRVALAAAKGLGLALGMPARGCPALKRWPLAWPTGCIMLQRLPIAAAAVFLWHLPALTAKRLSRRKTSPLRPQGKSWLRQARG